MKTTNLLYETYSFIGTLVVTRIQGGILIPDTNMLDMGSNTNFILSTGFESSSVKTIFTINGSFKTSVSSLLTSGSKIENLLNNSSLLLGLI